MRVVFAGTPEPAVPALEAVAASRHELIAVLTRPDAPVGRGRTPAASPVSEGARRHGVPVLKPRHPREPDFQAQLRGLAPDCCPVVAYGALLPAGVLEIPRFGWVNLHFSLLPAWRGAAPVQHALWAGDDVTGATTFRIVPELDAGPVYGVMTEPIRPRDTAGDLLARLSVAGADLLLRTLDAIEDGSAEAREQPTDGVSLAPKVSMDDARVDWSEPALAVDRRIRACTPAPGAWTRYAADRVKLGPVVPAPDRLALAPGALQVDRLDVHVGTGTVPVRLGEVRVAGKKPMPAAAWARGARLPDGARFGG